MSISLAEFKFYNKHSKAIDKKTITQLEKQANSNKDKPVYWTNKIFAENCIGFKLYYDFKHNEICIELNTFANELNVDKHLKTIKEYSNSMYCLYQPTDEQEEIIDMITGRFSSSKSINYFNNWEETKNYIILNKLGNFTAYNNRRDNNFIDTMKMLLDENIEEFQGFNNISNLGRRYSNNLHFITNVIEKRINDKNYRIAIIAEHDYDSFSYKLEMFSEDNKYYNYIDKDRLFTKQNDKYYFYDLSLTEYEIKEVEEYDNDKHQYVNIKKKLVNCYLDLEKVLHNNITNFLQNDECLIMPQIYNFYKERANIQYIDSSIKDVKLIEQYQKILSLGKRVKLENVSITKKGIDMDNEYFNMAFEEDFLDTVEKINELRNIIQSDDVDYNFNTLYEKIISLSVLQIVKKEKTSTRQYKEFEGTSFILNGMKIEVRKDKNRIKINGVFCRIDDIYYILNKAICYRDVNDYNKYVKEVSYIGADWKKIISNGIIMRLSNSFTQLSNTLKTQKDFGEMVMRFSFYWNPEKRNEVYLLLNNKKYFIKYKQKFKKLFDRPRLRMGLTELKRTLKDSVEDLTDTKILSIVENSIKEAKIIKKRGMELVQNTIKDIKAKKIELEIKGNTLSGYFLIGRLSGSEYFIKEDNLDVYKKMEGSWNRRCVVDDHSKQRIFEDRLANRLVNIYNEPKKIYTI